VLALGLQGSPRKNGNSDLLLDMMMQELAGSGIQTRTIKVVRRHIEPCKELLVCERNGLCPIQDDMDAEIYSLLRRADIIVASSPVFFYNVSAQLKALIDRCQNFWARKYLLKLKDPGHATRRGFFLAVGASGGKQLFDGLHLTAKYFFDAVDAHYTGSLFYRHIEKRGQIKEHPTVRSDVAEAVRKLTDTLTNRKKVLFVDRRSACRSQMAAAFASWHGCRRVEALWAGLEPAEQINAHMVQAMQEKGIDMAYRVALPLQGVIQTHQPDEVIVMDAAQKSPIASGVPHQYWDVPDPAQESIEQMRAVRDRVEESVLKLLEIQ
jgi:multimeric flavodoxin WrbA/protein-tyrosine-phosphatase